MSYYRVLNLNCEPFSTSPDPKFFYLSRIHRATLFRLRTGIELRRGLTVVAGDIGTGKSTMARKLSQIFFQDPRIDFHAILNPMTAHDDEFLRTLLLTFGISADHGTPSPMDCLQAIEKYLFQKGIREGKTVVLMIDEAQLLSFASLEVLRALLNYETNSFKLLQLVLFGQLELIHKMREVPNLWDRISLKLLLGPLDSGETSEMIQFRLHQARCQSPWPLFTEEAIQSIHEKSGGTPRRINILCHDALEYLVMMQIPQVTRDVVEAVSQAETTWIRMTEAGSLTSKETIIEQEHGIQNSTSQNSSPVQERA